MTQGLYIWSKTAATNANADSSINWQEGQAPSSVNDSARAEMARIAEYRDDNSGSLTTAGTSTAYTLTTNQVFDTLAHMNGQSFIVKFHTTNGATPTLNVDGLGAGAIQVATGTAVGTGVIGTNSVFKITCTSTTPTFTLNAIPAIVQDGTVATQSIAALAVTAAKIANNTITASQLAAGSVGAAAIASSFVPLNTVMLNGTIVESHAGNAVTFTIKTLAAATPSSSDPVTFMFRDATAATGDYLVRTVTGALSITIPSGQSMGFINATPGRIWIGALDNAGTVELFVINCFTGTAAAPTGIYPLQGWGIISTSAVSGASSQGVAYSTTGRSSVAYVPIGYAAWETGGTLGTAGTWNVSPTRIQIFHPGSTPLPGTEIQRQFNYTGAQANGATAIPNDDTIPQNTEGDQYMSQVITPTSSANILEITHNGNYSPGLGNAYGVCLFQDSTANALASAYIVPSAANFPIVTPLSYQMLSGTISATTFKIRAGLSSGTLTFNGLSAARKFGGSLSSYLQAREIMA